MTEERKEKMSISFEPMTKRDYSSVENWWKILWRSFSLDWRNAVLSFTSCSAIRDVPNEFSGWLKNIKFYIDRLNPPKARFDEQCCVSDLQRSFEELNIVVCVYFVVAF
jgi:hypothetical protein